MTEASDSVAQQIQRAAKAATKRIAEVPEA